VSRLGTKLRDLPDAVRHWWQVILLGLLTVGSYGFVIYSFSVLIGPIHDETGWSIGALAGSFTLSMLVGGVIAPASGWLLDRFGGRPVMLGSLAIGSAFLMLASAATSLPMFIIAWGIGGGAISAGLFYNVTMALTTRLFGDERVRAFAILTFIGGFAAVLYFPLAGLLSDLMSWRTAIRVLVVLMAVHALPAALTISGGRAKAIAVKTSTRSAVVAVFRSRDVVQMIAMLTLAAMAFGAIQVHHVPAMRAGGVSLGTATAIASIRGFLSLPGRALIEPVVRRTGVAGAIGLVYLMMAVGILPLAIHGGLAWPLLFMLITGLAFGAISPLHGLYAAEVFGEARIGTMMGVQSLIVSLLSATGPALVGLSVDATDSYSVAMLLTAGLFAGAMVLLLTRPREAGAAAVVVESNA
jgi:MFS family permease